MARKPTGGITTREVILRKASALFAERSYHGTSTRDIANEVGIRQPSLFHHFASKDDIMRALHDLEFTESLEVMRLAQSFEASAAARLYFAVYVEVRRLLDSVYDFTGTTAAAVLNDPRFAEAAERHRTILAEQTRIIAEGVESGEFIAFDPAFANRAVEWSIEGVLVDASRDPDLDATAFAEFLASFVVRALLADTDQLEDVRTEAMSLVASHRPTTNDGAG